MINLENNVKASLQGEEELKTAAEKRSIDVNFSTASTKLIMTE